MTLKDEQSVTVGKLKLEREKENPEAIVIELYKATLKINIAIILRARLSFEKEKSSEAAKEKLILEARLKALQEITEPKSSKLVTNFSINQPSEIIYKLHRQNYLVFLKECLKDVDPREYKAESTKFFNILSGRMKGEFSESEIDTDKLKNRQELNLVLEYLYNLMNNNKEMLKINGVGENGSAHIQRGLELFFQKINYVPNSKE